VFRLQRGPQAQFLSSKAHIAIYGGAAGGGKTWALLLQPLRHRFQADFSPVFFRRTTVQVRNPGGLWDESFRLYPGAEGEPLAATLEWRFPSGARIKFAHLEHDKTVLEWQGAQLPLICFRRTHAFHGRAILEHVRAQPLARPRGPLHSRHLQPRRR
jgi:hypothetical protein